MFRKSSAALLAVLVVASLAGCGFFGDGSRADEKLVDAAFAGVEGVTDSSVYCQQPLPGSFSCEISVELAPEATADQVIAALAVLRNQKDAERSTITVDGRSLISASLNGVSVGPTLSDSGFAEGFLRAVHTVEISSWELETDNYDGVPELRIEFEGLSDAQIFGYARAETIPFGVAGFSREGLLVEYDESEFPEDSVAVYEAVAAHYPVLGGTMRGGQLQVVLPEGTDLEAALAVARDSPSYSRIPLVDVTDDPTDRFGMTDATASGKLTSVIDKAREIPGYVSSKVSGDTLDIRVEKASQIAVFDRELSTNPVYPETPVRFSAGSSYLTRLGGAELEAATFARIANNASIGELSFVESDNPDGARYNLVVRSNEDLPPYDLGRLLAGSGLSDLDVSVAVAVRGNPAYSGTITNDGRLRITRESMSQGQADRLAAGWKAGS